MKTFKMSNMNTDAEGSPPPPPAPADPSVEAANAAVAAAAAAAAAAEGVQYNDMYPTYNTYLMTRYSDQRYHSPSYTTQQQTPSYSSHISAHTSTDSGYYRYPDYSRYPYSGGNPSGPTSPRWRRRSYDPEYLTTSRGRNTGSAGSSAATAANSGISNNRPLSDLAASLVNSQAISASGGGGSSVGTSGSTSSVLMRSRSRSRVPSEYDPNAYLRYVSPVSASSAYSSSGIGNTGSGNTTRPMSGYIYGHSYIPTTTSLHNMPDGGPGAAGGGGQPRFGSAPPSGPTATVGSANSSGQPTAATSAGVTIQPQPPPNYNAMDREVSARIRRYQADPSS